MRFARNVHFRIKNGKQQEFSRLFENEILPALRKHTGFEQEITLVNADGAIAISIWDERKNADAYQIATYPSLVAKLSEVIEGSPRVEIYDVPVMTHPAVPVTA